jgi:hypothetical protein
MPFEIPSTSFSLRGSTTVQAPIDMLHAYLLRDPSARDLELYNHSGRWMGQFPIPGFQRELCWDVERQVKLIESVWLGFSIGTYVLNDLNMESHGGRFHPLEGVLIDGQQRLEAFRAYFTDQFPVFGGVWSSLSDAQQRRFRNTVFPFIKVHILDEGKLREAYNRLAFGGVAHTEDQRA